MVPAEFRALPYAETVVAVPSGPGTRRGGTPPRLGVHLPAGGLLQQTVACARDLLKLAEELDYDYLLTAEAKSIPLIHEMARQSGAEKYFIARKGPKVYMPDPISVEDRSITTLGVQQLFLGRDDADLIKGKKILIVDDVISTGGSLHAMETLVAKAGGTVAGRMAVLAEGDAKSRDDIKFLAPLPTFKADGSVR